MQKHLVYKVLTLDDLQDAHQLLDHDIEWSGPSFSINKRKERLQRDIYLAQWEDTGKLYGFRAVVLKESNHLIGQCGFLPEYYSPKMQALFLPQLLGEVEGKPSPYAVSALEIGYALSSLYRGQGYAAEAVNAILEFAFNILKVERVFASTNRSNKGSIGLMKRVGMRTASNPNNPELEWPGAPGVLGVIENNQI